MVHLPQLIIDLGLILASAALVTLIFKKIRQPVVLGYILAGFLVGPYFTFFPTVSDPENISVWAEIGVIFLLFSLGLEFSFKKLVRVGAPASITAVVEVLAMLGIGYLAGQLLGWNQVDSIFLGGILSISSTTIIIRAFDELGVKSQRFATIVFGALIVEDLVAILLLVLLTTLAVSQQFAGTEMLFSVLKLVFFLVLWFVAGIFILPTFFKRERRLFSDETLLIFSIGLCLLMVMLATVVGFSPALGAFIMGSVLAETTKAERIEHLVQSVKNLFGAVFFVSVGMMINPTVIIQYALPIAVISILTIFGKSLSTTIGALLSGQPIKTSIQAGLSLAQIGEFSFIIATLGLTLKVTSEFLYPIAVAVSAITTFTTPYLIRYSLPIAQFVERKMPARWKHALHRYSSGSETIRTESDWKKLLRYFGILLATNLIISLAILLACTRYLAPYLARYFENDFLRNSITAVIALVAMSPFLWALGAKKIDLPAYRHLWLNNRYNRGPLVILEVLRVFLVVVVTGFLIDELFNARIAFVAALVLLAIIGILFSQRLMQFYHRLEKRFITNLNIRNEKDTLTPFNMDLTTMTIPAESSFAGKKLSELQFREIYGINLGKIERGSLVIHIPAANDQLFPGDKVVVIGSNEQVQMFRQAINLSKQPSSPEEKSPIQVQRIIIDENSAFAHQTIRDSNIRIDLQCLVLGIERDNRKLPNPTSDEQLLPGDVLWIASERNPGNASTQIAQI